MEPSRFGAHRPPSLRSADSRLGRDDGAYGDRARGAQHLPYFLQPIITDSLVAATFLVSLATARPVVARLAGDFYPMTRKLAVRPRIQRLFWHLTLMWACFVIAKALMTLWLLHSQSLQTFVVAKSISGLSFNALGIAVTIAIAMVVARKEGLMRPPPLTELAESTPVLVAA